MTTSIHASKRVPVIIDTDPGVDDVVAILMALASPELEILAYVISFGNTDAHAAHENIYRLYQAVGRHISSYPEDRARFPNYTPEVPPILAIGAEGPIAGDLHDAKHFHGRDGLGEASLSHPDLNVPLERDGFHANFTTTTKSGVDVASELLQSRPERSITYIAIGPLSSLALLLRHHREVVRNKIGRVIIMGGALDVPGNTTPAAEFNWFADAHAAKEVLCPNDPEQGLPTDRVLLIPLDITTMHVLPYPTYIKHIDPTFESTHKPSIALGKPPLCHFASSILERTREVMVKLGKDVLELHDITAIWCAIENPPVPAGEGHDLMGMAPGWAVARRKFDIERFGELTVGMVVVDRRSQSTANAPGPNRAHVQALFKEHHRSVGLLESYVLPAQMEIEGPETLGNSNDRTWKNMKLDPQAGVPCIAETPGPDVLLRLLTKRVWGVDIE